MTLARSIAAVPALSGTATISYEPDGVVAKVLAPLPKSLRTDLEVPFTHGV